VQHDAKLATTKVNLARAKRLDQSFEISDAMQATLEQLNSPMIWYVLVEGWCGDSGQSLPLIAKIAGSSELIELKLLFRDENPGFMDAYLTNGGKAIPKLIARDKETGKDLFTWGPRPSKITKLVQEYKAAFTLKDRADFDKNLHSWYAKDKGLAIQEDLIGLLKSTFSQTEK